MAESALDRKLGRFTVEHILYAAVIVAALALRLFLLEQKPQHHDESIHAFFSWKITESGAGDYKYDPVYHGPVLYYSSALVMLLLGDSDFTVRLSAVLFGAGILLLAWPLRRYLGRWGALSFLVLAACSPALTYFTRFLRHDIYLALCNLATITFLFHYGHTRAPRYLYLSAASFGLAFCTKEDMYLLTPLFLLIFAAILAWEVIGASDWRSALRGVWQETVEFFGRSLIPLLTSAVIFAVIWLTLYTSFFTHPENWNGVSRALTYWWGQHQIKRIGGPWWYYLPQLTLYEPLAFFPIFPVLFGPLMRRQAPGALGRAFLAAMLLSALAFAIALFAQPPWAPVILLASVGFLVAAVATCWVPDRFTRFAILWALGSLAVYGWAQEKVPWLLVPSLLPLLLVAGRWFGTLIESGRLTRPGAVVPVAAVGAFTLWSLVTVNYLYDAPIPGEAKESRHAEMLVYVQSTYDVLKVMGQIEEMGKTLGTGIKTRLAVSGNATWPFSWYLRHYPVNWAADLRNIDTPVVIVDRENNALDKPLGENYSREIIEIRGWWEPDWANLTPAKLMRWLFTRQAWNGSGSSDALVFRHKNLAPGMTFASVAVNPPPAARGYPEPASPLAPQGVWGNSGTAPGQFNEPRGLAADRQGNLYVVDSKNNRIQKLAPDGRALLAWGREGNGAGEFKDPCGIAVGPDENVYVADTWNHRVQKFDPAGAFLLDWREDNPGFWGPRGIAAAADGTVYVTDTGNKRVLAFAPDGTRLRSWGKEGIKAGEFIEPVGIAVDGSGNVVVADTGNRRLQFFDPQGTFVREWQVYGWEEFYSEPYIAAAGDRILITDSFNHRFARYADTRKLAGAWGRSGSGSGEFNRPIGIAVGPDGAVFVSDTMNNRVQKFVLP